MFPGAYVASLLGGTVSGMIVGDAMSAVPTRVAVPATGSGGAAIPAKATGTGTPVNSNTTTPRQHLYTSAAIVVGAIVILLAGSRALRDARIS